MARPLRQLLAEGADPLSVRAAAVLHALQLPLDQFMGAVQVLRAPADAVLLRVPGVMSPEACAALRAAVDEAAAGRDTDVVGAGGAGGASGACGMGRAGQ